MTEQTFTRFGGVRRIAARVVLPLLTASAALAGVSTFGATAFDATAFGATAFDATAFGGVENAVTARQSPTSSTTDDAYTSRARSTLSTGVVTKQAADRLNRDRLNADRQSADKLGADKLGADTMATHLRSTAGASPAGPTAERAEANPRKNTKTSETPRVFRVNHAPWSKQKLAKTCQVNAKLVPSCNILWGAAAGGFSATPRDQALREWEKTSGRVASIYHTYHRGDQLFPTKAEIAMANDVGKPRLLFTNWKVDHGTTWAKVAAGEQNARIDKLAAYIKANYKDKFFMAIHHEPENEVNATAGSGFTAKDYAKMFRHTVQRLRAKGVTNAVFVVAYMGLEKFYNQSWWYDLYPGDDVVDWIGLDAYVTSKPGGYHYGTLSDLVNRTTDKKKFPGFYNWHQAKHKNKPLMLSEWGVHEYAADPSQKAKILSTVLTELKKYPAIQAMCWFDTAKDQNGAEIRIDSSARSLTEFQKIARDPRFVVKIR